MLGKLEAGELLEKLARDYDCDPEAILRWKARKELDPGHFKVNTQTRSGGDDGALGRAAAILGGPGNSPPAVEPVAASEAGKGPENEPASTPPPIDTSAFKAPPITPETLPKIIEGIDGMIMQGIAATKRTGLPREVVLEAIRLPEQDKKTLEFFAPYAASYLPEVEKYARPVLAGMFVAVWGMSITSRTKSLEILAREYAARMGGGLGNSNGTT